MTPYQCHQSKGHFLYPRCPCPQEAILLHQYIVSRVVINPLGNVEYETRCIQSNFTSSSPIKTKSNKQRHFFAGEEYLVWLCKICFCLKVLEVYSRVKSFVTFCVEGDNLKHKTHTKPNNQFSFKLKQISSEMKKCHKTFFMIALLQ